MSINEAGEYDGTVHLHDGSTLRRSDGTDWTDGGNLVTSHHDHLIRQNFLVL
jgi:hypothetical protein